MNDPVGEGERWLAEARVDLGAADSLVVGFPSRACFLAQQAAEKAVKAILYAGGVRPVLGHSLGELGREAAGHMPEFEELRPKVAKLDRFYIPTRYPNGLPEGGLPSEAFDQDDARSAIEIAAKALDAARQFLDQARPEGSST
jgi:HEPN domain-containing protein